MASNGTIPNGMTIIRGRQHDAQGHPGEDNPAPYRPPIPRASASPQKKMVGLLQTSFESTPLEPDPLPAVYEPELPPVDDVFGRQLTHFEETRRAAVEADVRAYRQTLLQRAEQEAQALREQGYQRGAEEGMAKGESAYLDAVQSVLGMVGDINQATLAHFQHQEQVVIDLAMAIAEKLLHTQLVQQPEAIRPIIDDAIRRITDKNRVIIKVHPHDAPTARQYRDALLAALPDIRSLEITEDPNQDRGGCIIETQLGFIDASVKTKLQTLQRILARLGTP